MHVCAVCTCVHVPVLTCVQCARVCTCVHVRACSGMAVALMAISGYNVMIDGMLDGRR